MVLAAEDGEVRGPRALFWAEADADEAVGTGLEGVPAGDAEGAAFLPEDGGETAEGLLATLDPDAGVGVVAAEAAAAPAAVFGVEVAGEDAGAALVPRFTGERVGDTLLAAPCCEGEGAVAGRSVSLASFPADDSLAARSPAVSGLFTAALAEPGAGDDDDDDAEVDAAAGAGDATEAPAAIPALLGVPRSTLSSVCSDLISAVSEARSSDSASLFLASEAESSDANSSLAFFSAASDASLASTAARCNAVNTHIYNLEDENQK